MNFSESYQLPSGALAKLKTYVPQAVKDDFQDSWRRMLKWVASQEIPRNKIALPSLDGYEFLSLEEIIRLTADGSYTRIFPVAKPAILVTRKLGDFEKLLDTQHFFRIHRSHLINLNHLVRYHKGSGGYVVMSDGAHLDVSKRKREAFIELLRTF